MGEKNPAWILLTVSYLTALASHAAGDTTGSDVTSPESQTDSSLHFTSNIATLDASNSSRITVPNVLSLRRHIAFSFRTCGSGTLFHQSGASVDNWLRLHLNSEGILTLSWSAITSEVTVSDSVQFGEAPSDSLATNTWYTVDIRFLNGEISLAVEQGPRPINAVLVSNNTHNRYLWDLDLSGGSPITLGEGFTGCLQGGPGLLLDTATFFKVTQGSCVLEGTTGCGGQQADPCWSYPCRNGGTCVRGVGTLFSCVCPTPYSGEICETDLGQSNLGFCNLSPCQNGGECQPAENMTRKYECECLAGYTGVNCEININDCVRQPCRNGGQCTDGNNGYTCDCQDTGFQGVDCEENIDECVTLRPCEGGATCSDTPGSYKCECPLGFTGKNCQDTINECESDPCQHGATCLDLLGMFSCACAPGYTGIHCEADIDECAGVVCPDANAICRDLVNQHECVCQEGFLDALDGLGCVDVDDCDPDPCESGATCLDGINTFRCQCAEGYTGATCGQNIDDCLTSPCQNGGECVDGLGGYECNCASGYTGERCEVEINGCDSRPCLNGATCTDIGLGNVRCDCVPGFLGDVCEINIDECGSGPCPQVATCEDLINGFVCLCPPGFTGVDCKRSVSECDLAPCQNGGTCLDIGNGYTCQCTADWMGKNCTQVYNACGSDPCKNQGVCDTSPPSHFFLCTCATGFTGRSCETNIDDCVGVTCPGRLQCVDKVANHSCECPVGFAGGDCTIAANDCASGPCQNGGSCQPTNTSYACSCRGETVNHTRYTGSTASVYWIGYRGDNCEVDINECVEYPNICLNGGICHHRVQENNTEYGFRCFCPNGGEYYTGDYCQIEKDACTIVADPPACHNGGTCLPVGNPYTCTCAPGFNGTRCKINVDECLSTPCINGATCIDGFNEYTCTCLPGFTGQICEIDENECTSNPCQHGGVCLNKINGYECNCTNTGFNGVNCEYQINECQSDPCQNQAICQDAPGGYRCNCWPGYTGDMCEVDINECASVPCLNNGTCVELSDPSRPDFSIQTSSGYECHCLTGFSGDSCEINIDECDRGHSCVHGKCIDAINGYVCACYAGYMGLSCDIEINECTTFRPCQYGAECIDKKADYDCLCAAYEGEMYGGKNCSVLLTGCAGNQCENGATCVPLLVSEDTLEHSSRCDCPPGYYGPLCEKNTTASFYGNSWLKYPGTEGQADVDISLSFQTTLPNGLLLLNTKENTQSGHNHVILEISESRTLKLKYSNTEYTKDLEVGVTDPATLSDGELHQANVTIRDTSLVLTLYHDACRVGECVDEKKEQGSPPQQLHHTLGETWFGADPASHGFTSDIPALTGCVQDMLVDDTMIIPADYQNPDAADNLGVGCARVDQCGPDPCNSHGNCSDLWFLYNCSCWRPYIGDNCVEEYTAATFGNGLSTKSLAMFTLPSDNDHVLELEILNQISFFYRTRQESGLLFYLGRSDNTNYLGIILEAGKIRVLVRSELNEMTCDAGTTYTANGEQYYLRLHRDIRDIKLWLRRVDGTGDPTVDDDSDAFRCTISFNFILKPERLYIGGFPSAPSSGRRRRAVDMSNMEPFKGIIQDIRQNDWLLQMFALNNTNATGGLPSYPVPTLDNVVKGEVTDKMCDLHAPCVNNATCTDAFFNDYKCQCVEGFRGKNCSELDFCVSSQCPGNATCNNLDDGYECVSEATFDGVSSYVQYSSSVNHSVGISTVSALFRTREKSATLLHVRGVDAYISNFFTAELFSGDVQLTFDLGEKKKLNSSTTSAELSDGSWHNMTVTFQPGGVILQVDQGAPVSVVATVDVTLFSLVKDTTDIYVGGTSAGYPGNNPDMFLTGAAHFKGCMEAVRIGGLLLPFFNQSDLENNTSVEQFYADTLQDMRVGCHGDPVCDTHRCENNATCEDIWNDYECSCLPGYNGTRCENDIDECIGHQCQNNATCVDGIANYTCQCLLGYSGHRCEIDIDECASSPCVNNGTCMDLIGRYECNCTANYTGGNCQIDIRENCEVNPDLCNNGTCISFNTTEGITTFNCSCDPGFTERYCDTEINYCEGDPCVNNATCLSSIQLLNYTCTCVNGYTGRDCETEIDECASSPCQHGATCTDDIDYYECECPEGWNGTNCELDINECNVTDVGGDGPCVNGQCVNQPGSYDCNCTGSGYQGLKCETDIDECLNVTTCQNGANCTNLPGDFSCNCTLGYEGKNCDVANCSHGQCLNGGSCGVDGAGRWYCDCPDYVEGYQCESPGPCVEEPCQNNATCSQQGELYQCACVPGWGGVNCTVDVDECAVYAPCQNSATCQNTDGAYVCVCAPGFTDFNCSTDIDECESSPCLNGGACLDRVNGYVCNCTDTGFNGTDCEMDVDECALFDPCENGGSCFNMEGSFNCSCMPEYVGDTCHSLNPCDSKFCYNGGSCDYNINDGARNATPFCNCNENFYGDRCEFSPEKLNIPLIVGLTVGLVLAAIIIVLIVVFVISKDKRATRGTYSPSRQETVGSRVELGNVLKQPPLERLI